MSQFFETPTRTFTAAGALAIYLRVKTPAALALAGASDVELGTMNSAATAAGPASVRLRTAQGTRKMIVSEAVTAGNPVYAAASGKVAATGTVYCGTALETSTTDGDVIEVLPGPNTDIGVAIVNTGVVLHVRTRFTIAQINAGATLVAAATGYKFRVCDMAMISIGGAAATATTVDILATQGASSVKLLASAVAGLTQNTLLRAGATNATILTGGLSFVANDASTAITVAKTGSSVATATDIDVLLSYVKESA